ncbi:MAG: alpha-galactosidase [Lentisphaeria bacterium]|nr:alpha-galactosidase [Lentisphaeria bacterium]
MEQYFEKNFIELNGAGGFKRIGDYLAGDQASTPFSLFCEETGKFADPVITGRGNRKKILWSDDKKSLEIISEIVYEPETKVISRRDTLRNTGKKTLSVRRYLARFPFNRGEYELYSQQGRWRRESVGAWHKLLDSKAELSSREGRWCEGSAPYAVLRDSYSTHALAFMVCPEGDWVLRFSAASELGKLNDMTVEAGLSDDRLALKLAPGETWTAPEVMVQILPTRELESGTALMNRYLNHRFPARPGHSPVLYNTWLDQLNVLDVPRLERQLKAAKAAGCEVFIVDYGWYEDYGAFTRVDDWDECMNRAFYGKMRNFSDKVRAAGLGFGFWVEFEFFATISKVVKKHPSWFFPSAAKDIVCPKCWLPEVEDYLVDSLAATIRKYDAVYVKNDMNHSQGYEPERLSRYQKGMYRVMARLRKMFPEVVFDNCTSGSARMTAGGMLENFDIHFLSDNGNQLDNLRQVQELMLRFPPGRILHWFVASEVHSEMKHKPSFTDNVIIETQAATWEKFESVDLNTALAANLTGVPGYSCDLASFSKENLAKIAEANAFYKKYRESLVRSEGYWLTMPEFFEKRTGWIGLQFSDPEKDLHFLYIFHDVTNGDERRIFHPHALNPAVQYQVAEYLPERKVLCKAVSGAELAAHGFTAEFKSQQHARTQAKLLTVFPLKMK